MTTTKHNKKNRKQKFSRGEKEYITLEVIPEVWETFDFTEMNPWLNVRNIVWSFYKMIYVYM